MRRKPGKSWPVVSALQRLLITSFEQRHSCVDRAGVAPARRHFYDHAPAQRAPNALSARAASTRGARGWRFYICSLLKILATRPIPRMPSAWLGAAPAGRGGLGPPRPPPPSNLEGEFPPRPPIRENTRLNPLPPPPPIPSS